MAQVVNGRFTARMDGPFVVFLIGMRINRPLAIRKWLPTARAMGPMLRELYTHPEKGFLGGEFFFYGWGPALVQYWRSFEDLEKFARDLDDPHMPAWQRFNREARSSGAVGIWHETYLVEQGAYEAIYANMPEFGLAKATEHVPAIGGRETARRRLMREERG
jgi:Domain of unknown function (DUF4188)